MKCGSKNTHPKDMMSSKEFELCAKIISTILDSIIIITRGEGILHDYLMSTRIFTLITLNIIFINMSSKNYEECGYLQP